MKGVLGFLDFFVKKRSLHMKRNETVFKNEKYFNFSKMDKKNVQKIITKKVLTDRNFSLPYLKIIDTK